MTPDAEQAPAKNKAMAAKAPESPAPAKRETLKPDMTRTPSRYAEDVHKQNAKSMYGHGAHIVAGAIAMLRGKNEDNADGYTKTEMTMAIDKFLARKAR